MGDGRRRPLACRLASRDELKAYAGTLRELGKGAIEVALTRRAGRVSEIKVKETDVVKEGQVLVVLE